MILARIDHALMPSVIGPENLCHPFDRSDAKLNQSPLCHLRIPALKRGCLFILWVSIFLLWLPPYYDWPLVVCPFVMIGRCGYSALVYDAIEIRDADWILKVLYMAWKKVFYPLFISWPDFQSTILIKKKNTSLKEDQWYKSKYWPIKSSLAGLSDSPVMFKLIKSTWWDLSQRSWGDWS